MDLIAFLTDYGHRDGFPAVCHGVILGLAPHARILDITHDVPAYDVRHGAAVLARAAAYLPPAVLLGVVDPGVGTRRRGIALRAGGSLLVGPDNGLLPPAADVLGGVEAACSLDREDLFGKDRATTFDGRDIFAPVAARLATGLPLAEVGGSLPPSDLVRLPEPYGGVDDTRETPALRCEVTYVDGYGNVQLAARPEDLARAGLAAGGPCVVEAGARHPAALGTTFGAVAPGGLVVYVDADGRIAVAVNGGSAADRLGVGAGMAIRIEPVIHDHEGFPSTCD